MIHFIYTISSYCIFAPLNFNTEFFLSLDNEDKMSSKRCVINLVSLFFLLNTVVEEKIFLFVTSVLLQKGQKLEQSDIPYH